MKIKALSHKISAGQKAHTPIKQERPLIVKTKLNPYRVSRGRGVK